MNTDRFVSAGQNRWNRLSKILDEIDEAPPGRVGFRRLQEALRLGRQASADLAQARALTTRADVIDPINALVARSHRLVFPATGLKPWLGLRDLLIHDIPEAFKSRLSAVMVAVIATAAGALFGGVAILSDRDLGQHLVPGEFWTQSPRERVDSIEKGDERISNVEEALTFGASLYQHNIQVSFLAFALSAATIAGGIAVLFFNGIILGAIGAAYYLDGVGAFFVAWVGPHGALELPAIVFGASAGLVVACAFYFPGRLSSKDALDRALPDAARMLAATILLLLIAGLVEGSFSQFSEKTFSHEVKTAVAAILFSGLIVYLFAPRRRRLR